MAVDKAKWKVRWICEKYNSDADRLAGLPPYEVLEAHENLLLAAGVTELLKLLTGLGGTPFSSGNTYIYVGDSSTAAATGQVDLQGSSKDDTVMDATYPQVDNQTATWRGTFDGSSANFTWNECGVKNGPGAPDSTVILLNRKVVSFGTKPSGTAWTLTITVSIS